MSFCHGLSNEDLRRLRVIVKKVHLQHYPKEMCTDYEADKLIEAFGPEVAGKLVRDAMMAGQV